MGRYDDVAIIGMSGLFPEAADLDEFHRNLADGRDSVRPLSLERMFFTSIDPAHDYAPIGWLDRVDLFDHSFFNISPREAEFMDPHQRLTLQLVCAAIENAGYSLDALRGTDTSVFLSAPRPEYQELLPAADPLELLGNAPSALAGRVSYFLDLRGPSFVLDAGCCASLIAVEHARRELSLGTSRMAIAGGISLTLLFESTGTNAPFAEIMSPDAKCKAFDAAANGAAAGEGGGFVVLKRLADAIADGDVVHAVVNGAAVNQNGARSNGLSAPSPAAQKDLLLAAWDDAGVDPATISFIEAHGSGTRLGDVIEAQGLKEAFAERGAPPRTCAISSVKTNVGHLDHAAGIAGFIKAVLALKNQTLYRSLHFTTPNPLIDLEGSAVYVQERTVAWDGVGTPRRAGVSSFSLAGTNVHVVLEEAPARPPSASAPGPELVTLSARTSEALDRYRRVLSAFLRDGEHDLAEVAHTLNRGRADRAVRSATVVHDIAQLVDWLDSAESRSAPARRVALLLSGDDVFDTDAVRSIAAGSPAAARVLAEVEREASLSSAEITTLAGHLVVHAALGDLGVDVAAVLGAGAGNIAVKVVRGALDVAPAVALAGEGSENDVPDPAKLRAALAALGRDETSFVAPTPDGALGRALADEGIAVVSETPLGPEALLGLTARLYEAGATIDWDRHYERRRIRRVELPSHPFVEERSWPLPAGVHRATEGAAQQLLPERPAVGAEGDFATESERRLASIWADALGARPGSGAADYFELGGTSITGMVVLDGVERDFGIRLTFQELYEHSRLEQLAARIDELGGESGDRGAEPELVRIPRGGYLPASVGQEQIWFIDQLEPNLPLYNIPFDLHIKGALDVAALEAALALLTERHEVLRTSFVSVEGSARVRVHDDVEVRLPVVDLTHVPSAARRDEALRLWDEEASRPFDLTVGPLFRATLLRLAEHEHVLLMTIHHIIYDGWTPSIIQGELAALYDQEANGRPADLAPLAIQYADFADWQRRWVTSDRMAEELAYWKDHLAGAPVLELPTDLPRPARQTYRGEMITFELDAPLVDSLRDLSRSQGVTLFTTMTAAICILMQRYSGQDDIVIGTPTSGRKRAEIRGLIGYFNNMLPIRADLSGDPTFVDLMRSVRDVIAGALDHDEVPFEKMVEALAPKRDLSRNPLFQVAYSHQNAPQEGYTLPGMDIDNFAEGSIRGIAPGTSKFDLTIGVGDGGEGELEGYFEYATDLFERPTMRRMIRHLEGLLRSIAADPKARLSRLEMMSATEIDELLRSRQRAPDAEAFVAVHDAISAMAARAPDALAIASTERNLTYSELEGRANALAHRLVDAGVGIEDRVALALERSPDLIVAQLAALKAGAAFVALDPAHPAARLRALLDDCKASAVVARPGFEAEIPLLAPSTDASQAGPSVTPDPSNAAYVVYTSGSTGAPKGVVVSHGALSNLCRWHVRAYDVGPRDRATHLAPLSFDASVWETWPYLVAGASLHLVPDDVRTDAIALRDHIVDAEITIAFAPTGMAQVLTEIEWPASTRVRTLLTGGDRLVKGPPPSFPATLVNHYGPTENAVVATAGAVDVGTDAAPPIGTPIDGVRAYVLDRTLRPVPRGAAGELFLGGTGVARGYLGRPATTAASFLPDPWAKEHGARMYATGDVVRYRNDDSLQFLGRRDDQVKVRGFRIEPGEVEHALSSHPAVLEAAVKPVESAGTVALAAYVVPRGGPADPADIGAFLEQRLPAHMLPATIAVVDELPRSPHGKIDRAALPSPTRAPVDVKDARPRTPDEELLARIWSDVLDVDAVGIHDNFFDLGGDSILSIQIVARAAARGMAITAKDMFTAQTIAELAEIAAAGSVNVAEQGRVTGSFPPPPILRWFLDRELAEPNHFNQAVALRLPLDVDESAMRSAVDAIVDHHDALRLRVDRGVEGWIGTLSDDPGECFEIVRRDEDLESVGTRLQTALDLANGPVFRAALVHNADDAFLVVVAHHACIDVVSWGVLVDDLETAYEAAAAGRPITLPPKTTSAKEWATRLDAHAAVVEMDEGDYWRSLTDGSPARIRRDGAGDNLASSAEVLERALDAGTTAALVDTALPAHGVTIEAALLAALAIALRDEVEGGRAIVHLEGHGREALFDDVDVSRTVGWFTSLFPFDLTIERADSPADALRTVRARLEGVPHRGIGYGVLRYSSGAAAEPDADDIDVSFNYLGRSPTADSDAYWAPADVALGALRGPKNERAHLVDVEAWLDGDRIVTSWSYPPDLVARDRVEATAERFLAALRALAADARAERRVPTPDDFRLAGLDEAGLQRILSIVPDVEDAYPLSAMQQGLLFHSLFDPTSGVYFEQLDFEVRGELDFDAFASAWRAVTRRHRVLRASVVIDGFDEPLLVVGGRTEPPIHLHDWSALSPAERAERLDELRAADVAAGFDLERGPLTRVAVIRESRDRHRVLWSHHHLLLDGWSVQLVLGELMAIYAEATGGTAAELGPVGDYADFVAALRTTDRDEALAFWRDELAGVAPSRLGLREASAPGTGYELVVVSLDEDATRAVAEAARASRVTSATVVQAAWGLLLAACTDEDDALFGVTASGRSAPVPDVEHTVGLFINTIPARVTVDRDMRVDEWLVAMQRRFVAARRFEHTPLVDVQPLTGVPVGTPLFDTVLAFENYPLDPLWEADDAPLTIEGGDYVEQTNYPLAIVVAPTDRLIVRLSFDTARFDRADVRHLGDVFVSLLRRIADEPASALGALVASVADAMARVVASAAAPHAQRVTSARPPYVAPRTRTEDLLASIWADVLEVDRVGARDDFFALGGHSLIATRLASKLRELFGVEVPLRAVFDTRVLEDLAAVVGSLADASGRVEATVAAVDEMSDEEVRALLAELEGEGGAT